MKQAVAIVDDDRGVLHSIREGLSAEPDFVCRVYDEPAQGVAGILAEPPAAVLVDYRMPGMTGIECLRQIHHWRPEVPVIILTAYATPGLVRAALAAGAAGFVEKPLGVTACVTVLRDGIAGRFPLSERAKGWTIESLRGKSWVPKSPSLSPRQVDIVRLLSLGLSDKEIATRMGLSEHTVGSYLKVMFKRVGVYRRSALVAWYLQDQIGLRSE